MTKKEQLNKIETGIAILLSAKDWAWCKFCKRWDKIERFTKHHNHEDPDDKKTDSV